MRRLVKFIGGVWILLLFDEDMLFRWWVLICKLFLLLFLRVWEFLKFMGDKVEFGCRYDVVLDVVLF